MNQVFVSNHMAGIQANADHALWDSLVHTTGAADGHAAAMVGIWDPYNQRYLDGTTAALSLISPQNLTAITAAAGTWATAQQGTIIADGTAIAAGQEVINSLPTSPQFLNKAFQIVQALPSGNAIASPIIKTNQIKRLGWDVNNAPVAHVQTVADAGLSSIAVGDTLQAVFSIRFPGDIAFYEAQINPSGSVTNVTPALSAAFDNPKKIYKSTIYTAATTTVADEHNAFVDAIIADTSNSILDFVTVTESSNDLVATAKFFGMIIDVFVLKNGERSHGVSSETAPELGVGSFAEVLSAEKKAQYSQGHFNRMYLPTGGLTHASATAGGLSSQTVLYNRLVIEYENAAGNMPGFNGQANCSTATLYVPTADYSNQANQLAVEATFGLIDATASKEFIW